MGENKKEEKQLVVNTDSMSNNRKLFILRECIDFVSLGIKVDQKLIDSLYDDLTTALEDYEYCKEAMYGSEKLPEKSVFDESNSLNDKQESGDLEELHYDGSFPTTDTFKLTKKLYGELYDKLIEGIDDVSDMTGDSLEVYMYPNESKTNVKLRVWNSTQYKVARIYDDPGDLALNLEQDLKTQFNRQKTKLSKAKLSSKKEENKE